MFKKASERRDEKRENMRGGAGSITLHHALEKEDMLGKSRICAVLTVEPGCGIGAHAHGPDAEIFYLLRGELAIEDNGTAHVMQVGDVLFTGDNQVHAVQNKTTETAQLLAVIIE